MTQQDTYPFTNTDRLVCRVAVELRQLSFEDRLSALRLSNPATGVQTNGEEFIFRDQIP
jgi:hypothetical protein